MQDKKITAHLLVVGNPIPKARMTRNSRFTKRAKRSLHWQEMVALAWKTKYSGMCLQGDIELNCVFYRVNKIRADLDNLIKGLADGLQYGGAFFNDVQIKRINAELKYDKLYGRVEVQIRGI